MSNTTSQTILNFSWQQGAKISHIFPLDFRAQDLYKAVAVKLYPNFIPAADQPGCDNRTVFSFQLLYMGKTIPQNESNPDDKHKFHEMKKTMTTKTIILVVEHMKNGNNNPPMVYMDTHVELFHMEFNIELNKIVEHANTRCLLCLTVKNCMKIPCTQTGKCINLLCKICFLEFCARKNYTIQCLICMKFSDLESFLANAEFKPLSNGSAKMTLSEEFKISHAQFKESIELTRNIDFQICR
jgi:hypothetical protein